MQSNRLGCLTGLGLIAAIITVFVFVGVAFASGGQMFSSGKLNAQPGESVGGVNSHAQISECKACHTAPWEREAMANRCVACHVDIAEQMFNVARLHGAIAQRGSSPACRDCHPEHRGATASLTELGNNDFPHEELGYSLKGHQRDTNGKLFKCSDCHGDDVSVFASDSCQTCHAQMDIVFTQVHSLSFGTECLVCHDGIDTYGSDFDHNGFSFQLTGKHVNLNCSKCHLNARSISDMQVTLQDCYSCHYQDDPHDGGYGGECAGCHTPDGWTPATFDHNLSAFKLDGAHAQAACESCHKNGAYKGTSSACVSCHAEPVAHAGQFGTDCASCHSVTAWTPASFTGDHTFPLNHGERGNVSCSTCHPVGYTTYTCYGCHEHTQANIRGEHLEEGISNFQNCIECHADGREHEGGDD